MNDLLPPHAAAAEKSLIGAVLRDPDVLIDVRTVVSSASFYLDAHQKLFAGICAIRDSGRTVDCVTLHDHLRSDKTLADVGGAGYIADLYTSSASGALAVSHAKIVRGMALLRALIHMANSTLRECYEPVRDPEEVLAVVESQVAAVRRSFEQSADSTRLVRDVFTETMGKIDDRAAAGSAIEGVATGYHQLDLKLRGLRPGELIVVGARPSLGKAQPLDARLLTPTGFKSMGDIRVGDFVIGSDGFPTRVLGVYPQGHKEAYRVSFSDGSATQCCDEHLWHTRDRNDRRFGRSGSVKNLRDIAATLYRTDSPTALNHSIPHVESVRFNGAKVSDLPIHPYILGVILGDGSFAPMVRFNKPEMSVQRKVLSLLPDSDTLNAHGTNDTVRIRRVVKNNQRSETAIAATKLGLGNIKSNEKFVPEIYLLASPEARLELLRGLLDTDGSVVPGGPSVEFASCSKKLADAVTFLAQSLGGIARRAERDPSYTYKGKKLRGLRSYRVYVRLPDGVAPVSSEKHLSRWSPSPGAGYFRRMVKSVVSVGDKECQCIQVEARDGLYVTDDFIVTHNTALALNFASNAAMGGLGVLVFSLEMPSTDLAERLLAMHSGVSMHRLADARSLTGDQMDRLAHAASTAGFGGCNLWLDDRPDLTVSKLEATARRVVAKHGVSLVVVDYLQLMRPESNRVNRVLQIEEQTRRVKLLARELGVPIVLLSQLSRASEKENREPNLSDLRDCGSIEQDADRVLFLHRGGETPDDSEVWAITVKIAKNRNGPTGNVTLSYQRALMKYHNFAGHHGESE